MAIKCDTNELRRWKEAPLFTNVTFVTQLCVANSILIRCKFRDSFICKMCIIEIEGTRFWLSMRSHLARFFFFALPPAYSLFYIDLFFMVYCYWYRYVCYSVLCCAVLVFHRFHSNLLLASPCIIMVEKHLRWMLSPLWCLLDCVFIAFCDRTENNVRSKNDGKKKKQT